MFNHKKGQKQSHHEEHEVGNQGIHVSVQPAPSVVLFSAE